MNKQCQKCGLVLPLSDFAHENSWYCRSCKGQVERAKQKRRKLVWRSNNRDLLRAKLLLSRRVARAIEIYESVRLKNPSGLSDSLEDYLAECRTGTVKYINMRMAAEGKEIRFRLDGDSIVKDQ